MMNFIDQLYKIDAHRDRPLEHMSSKSQCQHWISSSRLTIKSMILATIMLGLIMSPTPVMSGVYKYKDKDGKWVFTDAPKTVEKDIATKDKGHNERNDLIDLEQKLRNKFNPQNPIEEATLGTVMVRTKAGSGSGFFVTNTGYIITNKHVVRINEDKYGDVKEHIRQAERTVNEYEDQFSREQSKLRKIRRKLDRYRDSMRKSSSDSPPYTFVSHFNLDI